MMTNAVGLHAEIPATRRLPVRAAACPECEERRQYVADLERQLSERDAEIVRLRGDAEAYENAWRSAEAGNRYVSHPANDVPKHSE